MVLADNSAAPHDPNVPDLDTPTIVRCEHHTSPFDTVHGHCSRCGVPVFMGQYFEPGEPQQYEDHVCPPGFLTPIPAKEF